LIQYYDAVGATVLLKDIVGALEMQSDECRSYLNLNTGEVETISIDLLSQAEECDADEEPDLLDWQLPEWEIAKQIVGTDNFKELPTRFDVHECAIMQEFSQSVRSDRIRNELLDAIRGSGAFRSFKRTIERHRIEQAWFAFRGEALRQIAIEWCEEHDVAWR